MKQTDNIYYSMLTSPAEWCYLSSYVFSIESDDKTPTNPGILAVEESDLSLGVLTRSLTLQIRWYKVRMHIKTHKDTIV